MGGGTIYEGECEGEIARGMVVGRAAVNYFTRVMRDGDVSAWIGMEQTVVFPVMVFGCEGWTVRVDGRGEIDSFWSVVLGEVAQSPMDC